jgi:molybdopterin molybdotransferase
MLSVDEVWKLIDERVRPLAPRITPLAESAGLALGEALIAEADQPASDLSAMDGYAVAEDSEPGLFRLVGNTPPGMAPAQTPKPGEALRVFTGSALPSGVKVVMQEDAVVESHAIRIQTMDRAGHVRRRGATAKRGRILLPSGTALHPAELGILASNGIVSPLVFPRPRIAHLTTGSEVVPPTSQPAEGQVRNANAALIQALADEAGAEVVAHSHCGEALEVALGICKTQSFAGSDVLIVSGGASVGDHDHTAEIFEKLGCEWLCKKVAIRPGKPLLIGLREGQVVIGLPGNPVSHFVTFHLFVRRILAHLSNQRVAPLASARLNDPGNILEPGKLETWWPALWSLRAGIAEIFPKSWLHSGHLSALAGSNALLKIPTGPLPLETATFLPCGEPVILDA